MLGERDKKRLVQSLERQGARIKVTKSGWVIFTQKGKMGLHKSESSDRNGDKSLRRDVERVGLEWPFGKGGKL